MSDAAAVEPVARTRLVIVGGGIGGLALAAALADEPRYQVTVIERTQRAFTGGAAIILWGNAVAALSALELLPEILSAAVVLEKTEFRAASGASICELPIGEWSSANGAPTVVIRRSSLIGALASRVPSTALRVGAGVRQVARVGEEMRVVLEDGTPLSCDAVVGADGFRSRVRECLGPPEPEAAPAYQAWVGIADQVPDELESGRAVAWLGRGPRFWAARLTSGQAFWYATLSANAPVSTRRELSQLLADWPSTVSALVGATPDADLVRTQIFNRKPSENWGRGPVTLLGDAAHPSTPDLGQGACQAIEGALVLSRCLRKTSDVGEAFREYERLRMPRTATISRLCALTWASSSMEGALACQLRNQAMRLGLRAIARPQLEWILAGQTQAP